MSERAEERQTHVCAYAALLFMLHSSAARFPLASITCIELSGVAVHSIQFSRSLSSSSFPVAVTVVHYERHTRHVHALMVSRGRPNVRRRAYRS